MVEGSGGGAGAASPEIATGGGAGGLAWVGAANAVDSTPPCGQGPPNSPIAVAESFAPSAFAASNNRSAGEKSRGAR